MPCTKRNAIITKRLQTELQSLLAFSCYDSKMILQCGKSAKKSTVIDRMLGMYMPSSNPNDDRMSHVEQLLEGYGKFKHLFVEKVDNPNNSDTTNK